MQFDTLQPTTYKYYIFDIFNVLTAEKLYVIVNEW